jgi:hypothetical protein
MKVLLTAFGGKLKGEMEVPDNWDKRKDIYLAMDMEQISPSTYTEGKFVPDKPLHKKARFQASEMHYGPDEDSKWAAEYKLVEVS